MLSLENQLRKEGSSVSGIGAKSPQLRPTTQDLHMADIRMPKYEEDRLPGWEPENKPPTHPTPRSPGRNTRKRDAFGTRRSTKPRAWKSTCLGAWILKEGSEGLGYASFSEGITPFLVFTEEQKDTTHVWGGSPKLRQTHMENVDPDVRIKRDLTRGTTPLARKSPPGQWEKLVA